MPGRAEGTNTIFFIPKSSIPHDRINDETYTQITVLYRPEKDKPNRTRLVVGGDRINYPGDCGTPTADLLTVKLLLNSIVSTLNAKFFTMDIKDSYLNTPLKRYEYIRLKLLDIPADIIAHYNLMDIATPEGHIHREVRQGMYGLPQAGIIAQELLEGRLKAEGYRQSLYTPGLWTHNWRPIQFTLNVDDFGVKYVGEEHAQHLLKSVRKHYKCSCKMEEEQYCGLALKWDYTKCEVQIMMPGYVSKGLQWFDHLHPDKPQDQPHPHVPPDYGAKVQFAKPEDAPPPSSTKQTKNCHASHRDVLILCPSR
jgi:hypothetical protein